MDIVGIDIAQIVDLGTQVANAGAVRALEFFADDVFDYLAGIAVVIYESGGA